MRSFFAYIQYDLRARLYTGIVPGIDGAHTQAATLDELQANLKEVLELCLEERREAKSEFPRFVGLQQVEALI